MNKHLVGLTKDGERIEVEYNPRVDNLYIYVDGEQVTAVDMSEVYLD